MRAGLSERMTAFMHKNGFYPKDNQTHLLSVSGGLDSVCMTHLYAEAGLSFAIAHCNFHLRADESDSDAAFVEALAAELNVPFHRADFDTKKAAAAPGTSTQMAARNLRYAFFEKIREKEGYAHIATAHHRDDSIETALFNFGRGTALKGMRGIPKKSGAIIRPLLAFGRTELEGYMRSNNLAWREDSSNKKEDYARNFIRHQVVPKFKQLNPNFSETAAQNMQRIEQAEANLAAFVQFFLEKTVQKGTEQENTAQQSLTFAALKKLPYPADILFAWLHPYGFDREQCRQLSEQMDIGQSGFQLEGKHPWKITRRRTDFLLENNDKKAFFFQKIEENDMMLRLENRKTFFMLNSEAPASFPEGTSEIIVDAKRLSFPLTVRSWKAGDNFQPFGMDGKHQKLQDFLTNKKIPLNEKAAVLVLENGDGKILWVLGHRMAEWAKVSPQTKAFLKFRVQ